MKFALGIGVPHTPIKGGGVLYLADYATPGDGASQHAEIAAAYAAAASGQKTVVVRDGEWFRTDQALNLPSRSKTRCENPQTGGFILDMATGPGITFGDGSIVRGLGSKSLDYPSSAIAFDANYVLGARRIKAGNSCTFQDVYMSDMAGGLEIDGVSYVSLSNINGSNLRSRSGWTAVVHCTNGANHVVGLGIYGTDCDRFCEVEYGSHDVYYTTGTGTNIYPNGYSGQPGAEAGTEVYANYSFVLDLGHSHTGEGACYNVGYDGFTLTNCLAAITALRSSGSNNSDLPHDCIAQNITVNTPRSKIIIDLQGYNLTAKNITFGGTRNGAISPLIRSLSSGLSDNIVVDNLTIPDSWYGAPVVQFQGAGSTLKNSNIGTRSNATTNNFYVIRVEANNCVIDNNFIKQPTYSAAVYYFAAGTSGNSRTNNTYTDAPANDPGAACAYNGTTVTESGNLDAA